MELLFGKEGRQMIYAELFWEFFKIGAFTFGGGYAMLPLIQQTVLKNNWISEKQMVDFIAVSESTPGPLAVNMSTYVGVRTAGFGGAFVAMLGVVLPSFIIILLISGGYKKFQNSRIMKGAMAGVQPAVVALIASAFLSVVVTVFDIGQLFSKENLSSAFIVLTAIYLCYKKKHPIAVIGVSALAGVIFGVII